MWWFNENEVSLRFALVGRRVLYLAKSFSTFLSTLTVGFFGASVHKLRTIAKCLTYSDSTNAQVRLPLDAYKVLIFYWI